MVNSRCLPAVEIQRSPRFKVMSQELGDFITRLPLTTEQNDTLVKHILQQITEAEATAFRQGFSMCAEIVAAE